MTTFIYSLECPKTNLPKYIGKSDNPNERFRRHLCEYRNNKKATWIRSLLNENLKPILSIINEVPIKDWIFWEKHYISSYKTWGFDLKNGTEGGDGIVFNDEIREKMSKASKGKPKSFEHRAKAILNLNIETPWNKGTKLSKENRDIAVKSLERFRLNGGIANLKIDKSIAFKIKSLLREENFSHREIANQCNTIINIVRDISRNKTWRNV